MIGVCVVSILGLILLLSLFTEALWGMSWCHQDMICLLHNLDSLDKCIEWLSEVGGVCHCIQEGWAHWFFYLGLFLHRDVIHQETIGNLIIQQQKTGHTWGTQQLIHTGLHGGLVIIKDCLVIIKDCMFLDSFVLIVVEPLDLLFTLHPTPP